MAHPDEDLAREAFAAFGRGGLEGLRRQYLAEDVRFHCHGRGLLAGNYQGAARVPGAGTFTGRHWLARDLAAAIMRWEQVPDLPLFANNTAFVHEMDASAICDVARDSDYVRVQVLTPAGVLDPGKQPGAGTPRHKHMSARLERLPAGCSA
jgi:hypothetical protein